jgi:flagellar biosynthetic protein FliQ
MDQAVVIDLAREALMKVIYVATPLLGLSLIVGLLVSVFQATTQIQEATLSFVPKILAVIIGVAVFGSWMLRLLTEYMESLYSNINNIVK